MGDGSAHDTAAGRPASAISHILRQMLHRWQSGSGKMNEDFDASTGEMADDAKKPLLWPAAAAAEAEGGGRGLGVVVEWEHAQSDDEREGRTSEAPADVPRGCCAVYVGAERRRFVVPTAYLGMPVFRQLLEKAEEEFGFDYRGGALTIPCETETFKYILLVMEKHRKSLVDDGNPTGVEGSSEEQPR